MMKSIIQQKKQKLEEEFKKVEEERQKTVAVVNQCLQKLVQMQGAYAQLLELEKEELGEK